MASPVDTTFPAIPSPIFNSNLTGEFSLTNSVFASSGLLLFSEEFSDFATLKLYTTNAICSLLISIIEPRLALKIVIICSRHESNAFLLLAEVLI